MRTDCNKRIIHFTPLARRQILAEFDAGAISSDGGVLLLREVDRRINLLDRVDQLIPDPRDPLHIEHDQRTLLPNACWPSPAAGKTSTITRICATIWSCNWRRTAKPAAAQAMSTPIVRWPRPRPSAAWRTASTADLRPGSTRCWSTSSSPAHDAARGADPRLRRHRRPGPRPAGGPLLPRLLRQLLLPAAVRLLRRPAAGAPTCGPANIDAAKHARAILKLLVTRLRQAWPGVKITIRGDSGFCRWRLMRWCDSHGVGYVLGLARNPALERAGRDVDERRGTAVHSRRASRSGSSARSPTRPGRWDRPRRVIVKAEHTAQGDNPRFVVTNLPGDPQELYEEVYCPRGEMENRIKEQQLGLFADRTSCHEFVANQFRLLLSSAAYVLVQALAADGLAGTELAQAQVRTIRLKLLKIGALVQRSVRRIVIHLSESFPMREVFQTLAATLSG